MRRASRVGYTAVSVAALLVVSSSAGASVTEAKPVAVKAWSGAVCKAFNRWEARLATLTPGTAVADPAAGKAAITKFLRGAVKATSKLADRLESAGVPKVEHGKEIAAAFANSVESLRSAYAQARATAVTLPIGDKTEFAAASHSLAVQLQTSSSTLSATLAQTAAQYPASALDKAFTSTKACAAIA